MSVDREQDQVEFSRLMARRAAVSTIPTVGFENESVLDITKASVLAMFPAATTHHRKDPSIPPWRNLVISRPKLVETADGVSLEVKGSHWWDPDAPYVYNDDTSPPKRSQRRAVREDGNPFMLGTVDSMKYAIFDDRIAPMEFIGLEFYVRIHEALPRSIDLENLTADAMTCVNSGYDLGVPIPDAVNRARPYMDMNDFIDNITDDDLLCQLQRATLRTWTVNYRGMTLLPVRWVDRLYVEDTVFIRNMAYPQVVGFHSRDSLRFRHRLVDITLADCPGTSRAMQIQGASS